MEIMRISDAEKVSSDLAKLINEHLAKAQKVLWLISGGSSIPIAVNTARLIENSDNRLFITLVDDIYSAVETDTNWYKLQEQGFSLKSKPILWGGRMSSEKTGEDFNQRLLKYLQEVDFSIGQFGIGEGYHTGGIQPGSVAAKTTNKLAVGYLDGETARVTITPELISRLDIVFINSLGEAKKALIEHFLSSTAAIEKEPTQALKTAKEVYLYSDVMLP